MHKKNNADPFEISIILLGVVPFPDGYLPSSLLPRVLKSSLFVFVEQMWKVFFKSH